MNDTSFEWLLVDLGHLYVISGVATQGLNSSTEREWVTSYQVWYSLDGIRWTVTMEHNKTKVILIKFRIKIKYVQFGSIFSSSKNKILTF